MERNEKDPELRIDLPLTVKGRVKTEWLSKGQWGPKGTMHLLPEMKKGCRWQRNLFVKINGKEDKEGLSHFSKRREYVKVPVQIQ